MPVYKVVQLLCIFHVSHITQLNYLMWQQPEIDQFYFVSSSAQWLYIKLFLSLNIHCSLVVNHTWASMHENLCLQSQRVDSVPFVENYYKFGVFYMKLNLFLTGKCTVWIQIKPNALNQIASKNTGQNILSVIFFFIYICPLTLPKILQSQMV